MIKKTALTLALITASISSAYAEWTYVYCALSDASDWKWLKHDGEDVKITGQWGGAVMNNGYGL